MSFILLVFWVGRGRADALLVGGRLMMDPRSLGKPLKEIGAFMGLMERLLL